MKKTHVNSNVDLNTLAGGAFAEKVNEALVQVGENIQNQNTEATNWWQQMAVSGKLRRSTTSRNTWRMLSTVLRTANRSQSSHNMIPA